MARYRKKPVVIDALRAQTILDHAGRDWRQLPQWITEECKRGNLTFGSDVIYIRTSWGILTARAKDWLIRGVDGELYPCRPDIFEATYEPADAE